MSGRDGDGERGDHRRGYRYRPADPPGRQPASGAPPASEEEDDDLLTGGAEPDDQDEFDDQFAEDEGDEDRPSEFWPATALLKGATIEDAELELSYSASVYVDMPAAELRLWLALPDGTRRLVQVDEPHAVWLYRQAHRSSERDFEEYPDHRFELLCTDIRATRGRRQRQLIDRQLALHEELVAVGEELEELERDMQEDAEATAGWPGVRWP